MTERHFMVYLQANHFGYKVPATPEGCLLLVNILMPYNFVRNPVKDVENEEG